MLDVLFRYSSNSAADEHLVRLAPVFEWSRYVLHLPWTMEVREKSVNEAAWRILKGRG